MRLKLFLLLLVIIAFIASFYAPTVFFKVAARIYSESSSPYNLGWKGTSALIREVEKRGLTVTVVESEGDLLREISSRALLLVVAPDKPFNSSVEQMVEERVWSGSLCLAVFDENTTVNSLIEDFGLRVDGRAILDPLNPGKPAFPVTLVVSRNGSVVSGRLNWASPVHVKRVPGIDASSISLTIGVLDANDNGLLDEPFTSSTQYVTGVLASVNSSLVLVFGDSYPVLNDAFARNLSITGVLLDYVVWLGGECGGRVVVPNYLYKVSIYGGRVPFHVSLLYLLAAEYLKSLEEAFVRAIARVPVLSTLLVIAVVLALLLALRSMLGLSEVVEYSVTPVKPVKYIVGSVTAGNLLDKRIIGGREKELVKKYWDTLATVYKTIANVDLARVLASENTALLERMGFSKRDCRKLAWLYKIYVKASQKRILPFVLSWRSVLVKVLNTVEEFLNKLGYTVMNREGYRDATALVK